MTASGDERVRVGSGREGTQTKVRWTRAPATGTLAGMSAPTSTAVAAGRGRTDRVELAAPAEAVAISVVVPAYDERESLPILLAELSAALLGVGRSYEIVLVDDGSRDGTADWIVREEALDPHVVAVGLAENSGQSAALAAGFRHARGEIIVTLDADLQNDPADLALVLAGLEHADVVSGARRRRLDSWSRRLSSRIANAVRRAVIGDSLTDIGCSFKAYRREALEGVPMFTGAHRFLPALCQFRGARVIEVPLAHRPRRHGRSKYGVGNRLGRGLYDLVGVRWLKSRMLRSRERDLGR
jgi:dolichol-phosphate mannosyltransferase